MSAIGTKRTSQVAPHMSAFGDKAPALSGLSPRGEFDPAQGRLPSREVRFKTASDPSCDRSHSAVLLVGHGPHFHLAPGVRQPSRSRFCVAIFSCSRLVRCFACAVDSQTLTSPKSPRSHCAAWSTNTPTARRSWRGASGVRRYYRRHGRLLLNSGAVSNST